MNYNGDIKQDLDQVILAIENGDYQDAKALIEEIKDEIGEINFNFYLN